MMTPFGPRAFLFFAFFTDGVSYGSVDWDGS
jgi:hypothetical protein